MRHPRPILSMLTVAVALGVPAAARADDASFSAVAKAGITTLASKEKTTNTALQNVSGDSDVPKAKLALGNARSFIKSFVKRLQGKNPSTDDGDKAKGLLITALRSEDKAYGQIADALDALRANQQSKGDALLKKAKTNLKKAVAKAKAAGTIIGGLTPPAPAPAPAAPTTPPAT